MFPSETGSSLGVINECFDTTQPRGSFQTEYDIIFQFEKSYIVNRVGYRQWSITGSGRIPQPETILPEVHNEARDLIRVAKAPKSIITKGTFTAFGTKKQIESWEAGMKTLKYTPSRRKQVRNNRSTPIVQGSLI